ncbi:TonB-dependent receptor [Antarcticibacterium arcticum]|uniref:TonB-dependent receptor n=2 Tax=Antarcticibacterium arcticum TaxID=2585771 RepID=A0A5B8YP35_9FLAO|nr:TonB-dependent receptor [Antarcticibacterium arcticum]
MFYLGTINAQQIEGIVKNTSTELPVGNVIVQNLDSQTQVLSAPNGAFQIDYKTLPVDLRFSASGFESLNIQIKEEGVVNIYLIPLLENLSEVIIRGTHIPGELHRIPAAVSVLSRQDLEKTDPTNFAQAFNNVPGVYVNQGALNTTKLNIRGVGARSQYSTNRIQAYFNGFPLTTAEGELTLDDIDPEAISRVEVIKGPASSLYGAGLGGVINLFAEEAGRGTTASVNTLFGSYNMTRKSVSASHGSDNTNVFINYNDLQTDGFRENGEYERKSLLANVKLQTAGGNSLNFLTNFTRLKAFIPSSITEEALINSPESAASNWAAAKGFESYDRGMLGVSYEHLFSPTLANTTTVYLNFRDAYEPRPFDILKEERVSAGARSRFNLETAVFEKLTRISFGAEYYREWYESGTFENLYREFENIGSVLGSRLSNNEQDRNYSNIFAQLEMELSAKFKIETGVNINSTQYRLTDLFVEDEVDQTGDYKFKTILSPRIGATYELQRGKNFYASVSHGFSTPTVAETLTPEGQINTDLLPETGINYEAGFKGNWLGNNLYTEVAFYSIQIEDLLVAQRVAEDRYIGRNAGKTTHNGVEMFINYLYVPFEDFSIKPYFNASFNFFEFKEFEDRDNNFSGNKIPGVPESTVNLGLDISYGSFSIYSNLLAVGEIPLNDANSLFTNNYKLVNLKATYGFEVLKNLEITVSGGVNNALDDKYASSVLTNAIGFGAAAPRYYYPGNPRNYYTGIGGTFRF